MKSEVCDTHYSWKIYAHRFFQNHKTDYNGMHFYLSYISLLPANLEWLSHRNYYYVDNDFEEHQRQ